MVFRPPFRKKGRESQAASWYDDGALHEHTYKIRLCDLINVFLIVCFAF